MVAAGLVVTLAGFLISLAGLGLISGVGGRMVCALVGIGVSLYGIMGLLNPAYQAKAIWRRDQ